MKDLKRSEESSHLLESQHKPRTKIIRRHGGVDAGVSVSQVTLTVESGKQRSKKRVSHEKQKHQFTCCEKLIILLSWTATIVLFPLWFQIVRQVKDYQRAVVLRLGQRIGGAQGPGIVIINPLIDKFLILDLRTTAVKLKTQNALTRDSVTVRVSAIAFMKVRMPVYTGLALSNFRRALSPFCQTTLRAVIGKHTLSSILSERDKINSEIRRIVNKKANHFGVNIPAVELMEVRLPKNMQRAMAAEAVAERQRRAKIIASRGEAQAAEELARAARVFAKTTGALQLRYLHTLKKVAKDKNKTILFSVPVEIVRALAK